MKVTAQHPLRRYWYNDGERYPAGDGCRRGSIRCGGCRCSAPSDGSRCPCCGWQSSEFLCVVCGGRGTIEDSIFQARGPVHERHCAGSAWLRTIEHGDIMMPEWAKYTGWCERSTTSVRAR